MQASTGSRSPATTTRASAIAALEDLRLTCAGTFAQNPEAFASHSNEIPDAVRRRVVEQFPAAGLQARVRRAVARGGQAGPSPPGVVPAPLRRHRPEHSDGAVRLTEHGRDGASSVHASSASSKERLAARPAGSASFTAGPRRRRRTHLEPSHANARRLFERDIEGRVTTLNLLRLREACPCSGTSHLPRRGRERWDDLMPHVAATAGPMVDEIRRAASTPTPPGRSREGKAKPGLGPVAV